MFGLGLVFLTTSIAKPIAIANETQEIKEKVTQQVKRLANRELPILKRGKELLDL